MSITDELREYARGCAGGMGGDALLHIADCIEDAAHEEAKRIAKMAFDGGIEYERTCKQYNCDAKAYNWDGWLKRHAALFQPKPTVQSVLLEFAEKITDSQIPGVHPTYEEAIADYAKRLRLAEEVDA